MQNIGFTTSPDRTKIAPETLGETIEHMAHYLPTICSRVSNGFFSSISRAHTFIFSGHIRVYCWEVYGIDKLTI